MDYLVRQVYTVDLPSDPYVRSPTAPSVLSSLTLLPVAARTPLPSPSAPPSPLHGPTSSLLTSTVAFLFPGHEDVEAVECFRVLRAFVDDFRFAERKLGLKGDGEDGEAEVEDLQGWLEGREIEADGEELVEEDEGETMSMRDFLGGESKVDEGEEEDAEEDDGAVADVRIDVRRRERAADVKEEEEEEDEDADYALDEVQLDELKLEEVDEDDDGGGLHGPPARGGR